MTTESFTRPSNILDHNLNKFFPELLKFESTVEMEASPIWPEIREDVERILSAVVVENFSPPERDELRIPDTIIRDVQLGEQLVACDLRRSWSPSRSQLSCNWEVLHTF